MLFWGREGNSYGALKAPRNLINLICEVSLQACFDEAVAMCFGVRKQKGCNSAGK